MNEVDNLAYKYKATYIAENLKEIRTQYSWKHLVDQHEEYFKWLLEKTKGK